MLVKRRTLPIPRFPAPFVNLLSESHEFLRDSGVAEVCSSSPMKKAMNSASVVGVLKLGQCSIWALRGHVGLKLSFLNVVGGEVHLSKDKEF